MKKDLVKLFPAQMQRSSDSFQGQGLCMCYVSSKQRVLGLLRDSDLAVVSSVTSIVPSSLSLSAPFNIDPASPSQRDLLRLPEPITQLELPSSSFALTRLFGYRQLNMQCSLRLWFHAHTPMI